jgi:replicative DNA helicase
MNLELSVLWALTRSKEACARALTLGLSGADFDVAAHRQALAFIFEHQMGCGGPPSTDAIVELFRLDMKDPGLDPSFVIDEMDKRRRFRAVQGLMEQLDDRMRGNDPDAAIELIRKAASGLNSGRLVEPTSLLSLGDRVLEVYQKVQSGELGVPFPWEPLTNMTLGMWKSTVTMFVARPGQGKTWVEVICARHAFLNGINTLFISPEMSKDEIAERFFVMDAPISYKHAVRGVLSEFEMAKIRSVSEARKDQRGLWVMDYQDDLTPRGIESAVRAVDAQFVVFDTLYALRVPGDKMERTERALDWMMGACRRYGFAAVAASQQNRKKEEQEKFGGGARLGTIAFSDQIGMDAHAVFALEQTADMRADKIMKIIPLKLRRGIADGSVSVRWDFDTMNFEAIDRAAVAGFDDSDGGDIVPF